MKAVLATSFPSAYRTELFEALGRTGDPDWAILFGDRHPRTTVPAILPVGARWSFARGGSVLGTAAFLLKHRPDAIVVGGAGVQGAVCVLYGRLCRRPTGVWWGGTVASEAGVSGARHILRRGVLGRAAFFFCYGPESARYLESLGVPASRVTVLGNVTLDVQAFHCRAEQARRDGARLREELGLEAPVVLSVGRLIASKNHERLARALLGMRSRTGAGTLLLIGDGPERDRLEGSHVKIIESVEWPRMPDLYGVADIYAHASLYDRWPQAISEALAAGTAVVASSQSGLGGFLRDNDNALVVDGRDEEALRGALTRLATDDDLRQRLGAAGHHAVRALGAEPVAALMSRMVMDHTRGKR